MDLFQDRSRDELTRIAPLSARVRPRHLDEFHGQQHLVGEGKMLRALIEADRLRSMILWGPPGSGKTTLAQLISRVTGSHWSQLSAVNSRVHDLRREAEDATHRLGANGTKTILFIDEIHRYSKSQQDSLLPHVEAGTFVLIGATTENPSFELNAPLLSRARVYILEPLSDDDIRNIIATALADEVRGLGHLSPTLTPEAESFLLRSSSGDARTALDALEVAVESVEPDPSGIRLIAANHIEQALNKRARYDKLGDAHYDTISAFIKSIRASDPDAAIYYLARMIDAGEDPMFIARRLVVSAAEDVGLANPNGLAVAVAAQQAVHFVGMPEGRIPLAEATIFLASAPKSNSAYLAIDDALDYVRRHADHPVPAHMRNAPTRLAREMGHSKGYVYPHDHPGAFVPTRNLPEQLGRRGFFMPKRIGAEGAIAKRLMDWWQDRYRSDTDSQPQTNGNEDDGSAG